MQLGLYSITYLGLWYRGEPLSLEGVLGRARQWGYEGVELDGKRPHASPLDLSGSRCAELRRVAAGEGVPIYAVAANNDFSSPVEEQREAQIAWVRDLAGVTAALGAPVLRVFAAWPGVTRAAGLGQYDAARALWREAQRAASAAETWARCRDGLAECARYAADAGITLALQNHPPVIDTCADLLRMIEEIGSPALKACLDAPLVAKYDRVGVREAARATGALQVLSHFGGEYRRDAAGAVHSTAPQPCYADFVAAMREIGYQGFVGYELCHPLPAGADLQFADDNARLAAEYMRALLQAARGVPA